MASNAEILAQARELPIDERLALSVQIAEEAINEREQGLSEADRDRVAEVLARRVEGPFEQLQGKEAFTSLVMKKAAEINAGRNA